MNFDTSLVIVFTSIIQSIFGTGVLLFGTPLLLLIGYDFQSSLVILLPTSLLINLFQLKNNINKVDIVFYKKLVLFSVPSIVLSLYIISLKTINLNQMIGLLLILIALKEVLPSLKKGMYLIIKNESIYLVITGIVHGLSNLGGALLSAIIFSKKLSKEASRATIAMSYLTFAIFQIITLFFFIGNNSFISFPNILYWSFGIIIFMIIENTFYVKINKKVFSKFFTVFIICVGVFLIIKDSF